MTCFAPLQGYEADTVTARGKRKTTFSRRNARADGMFKRVVNCGRCIGCRMGYSQEWAVRISHEASLYSANSFITLTYNDEFLPRLCSEDGRYIHTLYGNGSLNFDHWEKFMKRLRRRLHPIKIRFYMGSEYGDQNFRPHYHAIIFNYGFPDRVLFKMSNGLPLYRSALLEDAWTDPDTGRSMGFATVGEATFQSAAYVARYMMKKVKGEDVDGRYKRYCLETGEVFTVEPEVARMSNRNGIGKEWFDLYHRSDVYAKDGVTVNGIFYRPPKFYDRLFSELSPDDFERIKRSRQDALASMAADLTPERLKVRETCLRATLSRLPRSIYKNKEFL